MVEPKKQQADYAMVDQLRSMTTVLNLIVGWLILK